MMTNWKYCNHRNICPVCEATKNCRQSPSGLYHCWNPESADESKFVYRGQDQQGFSMFCLKTEAIAWKNEKFQEYKEEKQREKEREKEREEAKVALFLSDSERDIAIRSVLSELSLTPEHYQHLKNKRGMSDEQIEMGMYRSIYPWQKLNHKVNVRLAGVQNGKRLNVGVSGILCPLPNAQGEFVGWQIRLDDATKGDSPKYLWAKGETNGLSTSAHLKNGELPLGFYAPSGEVHPVVSKWFKKKTTLPLALTEGVSFKPAIAADRLGIHAIGASGGNFASSSQTLKTYLEHIEKTHEGQKIMPILFADAGSLLNTQVLKIYENTHRELKNLGYELKIAYWGQDEKRIGDIDEIGEAAIASIKLMPYQKFTDKAKKNQYHPERQRSQIELESLTYESNIHFDTRYLPDNLSVLLPLQGLVALKSPKGTGKSVQIKKLIENAKILGKNVISITPRRALGREQSTKWEINWIGDAEIPGLHLMTIIENIETIALCWDSLWKLQERDWNNTLVIIDEVELANSHHLLSSTCKEKRPLILKVLGAKLRECLDNNGMVVIADADLSNTAIDYFKELVPDVPTFIVTNDYTGTKLQYKINFYTGRKDHLITKLIADLALPVVEEEVTRQRRIVISVDSQEEAEALQRYIFQCYPALPTIRIDSTITETDEGREFVEHPNEKITELQPIVLIYTSSMGIGVSIDLSYFDQMYAFFTGVLEPSQCRQMLGRVREPIPRSIWCKTQGHLDEFVSFEPEEIKSRLLELNKESSILCDVLSTMMPENPSDGQKLKVMNELMNPHTGTWDNPHINLYCKLVARRNFGLFHLSRELHRQLEEEGHTITDFHNNKKTEEGIGVDDLKKSLKVEEAEGIYNSRDISLETALQLKQKGTTTKQERREISKALLRAELPEIPLTPEFIHKVVTKDNRRWLNQQKLFWYLENSEITKVLDRKEWVHHLEKFNEGIPYIPDIKTYSVKVKLLKDIGLFTFIDLSNPEKEYSNNDPYVQKILDKAKKYRRLLRLCFNLKITEKTKGIQFINYLLKRVGIYLKLHHQSSKGIRFYRVDADKLADPDRLAILKALTTKWGHLEPKLSESQQKNSSTINNVEFPCDSNIHSQPVDEANLAFSYHPTSQNQSP